MAELREVSESRRRVLTIADETRRQIGRDLHDGAQQGLVVLRIKLSMEADRLRADQPEAAAELDQLGLDVERTIDELRGLARGIYPAMLANHGLAEALRWVALEDPMVVSVATDGVGRYEPEIERAVYFSCLEALQNSAKHAGESHHVWITLAENGALSFEVRDDGAGWTAGSHPLGNGLSGIHDRLAAVGGSLEIETAPGYGTKVRGRIPWPYASS